jgi:PhoPQ-activated pathogenicity-related protein
MPTWPLRLPMTKAAVRAMDTVTAVAKTKGFTVDHFVVSGASKRGWTTWTTAAVDKRVSPSFRWSSTCLNVEKSLEHHYSAYGSWAPSLADYTDMKTFDWFGTPQLKKLMDIEDPYSYLDRLTMPKYIVNSGGDQYFTPDSSQFYWKDLKGEKYLRYVPNTKHDLNGSDARESADGLLHDDRQQRAAPADGLEFREGRLHSREGDREAHAGCHVAGEQSEGPRLPSGFDRQGVHQHHSRR